LNTLQFHSTEEEEEEVVVVEEEKVGGGRSCFRIVHAQGEIPDEVGQPRTRRRSVIESFS
jgi:hypothetical protein